MPAALRGALDVDPDMNQRSSARTARRKTRFVVRRGRTGMISELGSEGSEGLERANLSCVGAKREYVPVPVRSGRCSPVSRISRSRERYWCSSWWGSEEGAVGILLELLVVSGVSASSVLGAGVEFEACGGGEVAVVVLSGEDGVITGSRTDDMIAGRFVCNFCMPFLVLCCLSCDFKPVVDFLN